MAVLPKKILIVWMTFKYLGIDYEKNNNNLKLRALINLISGKFSCTQCD